MTRRLVRPTRGPCCSSCDHGTGDAPVPWSKRAYSSKAIRADLRRRGIRAVIPEPADQQANRKRRGRPGGRPTALDRDAYRSRNAVERCINRLKQRRGIAMRTDKLATNYPAALHVAAIFHWLKT